MPKEYYSTIEAANILRVSRKTVFQWAQSGKIKATKVGRNYIIPHTVVMEMLGKAVGTEKRLLICSLSRWSNQHNIGHLFYFLKCRHKT